MANFKVYFEIYNKKLCATVDAVSEHEAKEVLKSKIVFHKIEEQKETLSDLEKKFEDIFIKFGL